MTPPASVEPVRVFRYKHRNVSLRGEDPTPPVTTLFMAYDPLPGTSYSGEDGRWLPVDAYTALMARIAALEDALAQVVPDYMPDGVAAVAEFVRETCVETAMRLVRARDALGREGA